MQCLLHGAFHCYPGYFRKHFGSRNKSPLFEDILSKKHFSYTKNRPHLRRLIYPENRCVTNRPHRWRLIYPGKLVYDNQAAVELALGEFSKIRNKKQETRNKKQETRSKKQETRNKKSQEPRNPEPETQNLLMLRFPAQQRIMNQIASHLQRFDSCFLRIVMYFLDRKSVV